MGGASRASPRGLTDRYACQGEIFFSGMVGKLPTLLWTITHPRSCVDPTPGHVWKRVINCGCTLGLSVNSSQQLLKNIIVSQAHKKMHENEEGLGGKRQGDQQE